MYIVHRKSTAAKIKTISFHCASHKMEAVTNQTIVIAQNMGQNNNEYCVYKTQWYARNQPQNSSTKKGKSKQCKGYQPDNRDSGRASRLHHQPTSRVFISIRSKQLTVESMTQTTIEIPDIFSLKKHGQIIGEMKTKGSVKKWCIKMVEMAFKKGMQKESGEK